MCMDPRPEIKILSPIEAVHDIYGMGILLEYKKEVDGEIFYSSLRLKSPMSYEDLKALNDYFKQYYYGDFETKKSSWENHGKSWKREQGHDTSGL